MCTYLYNGRFQLRIYTLFLFFCKPGKLVRSKKLEESQNGNTSNGCNAGMLEGLWNAKQELECLENAGLPENAWN